MAKPIRVGVLDDLVDAPPSPNAAERWLTYVWDELRTAGRLDRDLEVVHAYGLGLPAGTAAAIERAFVDLVAQDVVAITGPAIGDNALIATPLAERHGIPTINWAGSERARGPYMFQLQVGSHEDEASVIVRHLLAADVHAIGVVYDRSPIGRRYFQFLNSEAEIAGIRVLSALPISPITGSPGGELKALLSTEAQALVYLGLGLGMPALASAIDGSGWKGHRVMNTSGMRGQEASFAAIIDRWHYIDVYADDNETLVELLGRTEVIGTPPMQAAVGYDLGRLVAEGVARAAELTRDGVRGGLEQIKWLPAAEGHRGTLLGFGHHEHGALHGRYLVTRQWVDGASVQAI